ncbi:hypothetical protein [Streptomyces sp. NPDC059761]|uniref:hypothetical protein n=1 Tax=Streptomyces sp. NPDC059761 TaxID=3346937 RepID=UPI00365B0CBB
MSETTPNTKGPAPVQLTPKTAEPVLIPAAEVKPEDIATLSIEYRDGQPVIVATGGTVIPAGLAVVDGSGKGAAARYSMIRLTGFQSELPDDVEGYRFVSQYFPLHITGGDWER